MSDADTAPHASNDHVRKSGIEMAALRKMVYQLAGDPDDASLMEAALMVIERFQEMEERIERLERTHPDDGDEWP